MRALVPLIIASALGGCAQLKVEVDVLKPSYIQETTLNESLRIEAIAITRGDQSETDIFIATQKRTYLEYRRECLTALRDNTTLPEGPARKRFISSVDAALQRTDLPGTEAWFATMRQDLLKFDPPVIAAINTDYDARALSLAAPAPLSGKLKAALLLRRNAYIRQARAIYDVQASQDYLCPAISAGFTAPSAPAPPPRPAPAAAGAPRTPAPAAVAAPAAAPPPETQEQADQRQRAAAKSEAAAMRVITGGGLLLLDRREAWAIVSAPDDAWATDYNQARVVGVGGSTDIAIKLNSAGDFTVKGFTFDSRSTATMVSKVGGQALRLVAAAYGAPIPGGTGQGDAAPATGEPPLEGVNKDLGDIAKADAEDRAFRAALFKIADAVLADPDGLAAGQASAMAAAQAPYDANKARWTAAAPPP